MAVRSTMAALIARVRLLINDPSAAVFQDQDIQDVMDESRVDYRNSVLIPQPTFTGSTIQFLDFWHELGGWEDGYVIKQYLVNVVTPATLEPIAGHWTFSTTTLPPLYISGSLHDVYRAAADLLERQSTQWMLRYNATVDGQNVQRGQVITNMQLVIKQYRMKQRAGSISVNRTDTQNPGGTLAGIGLGPVEIDYMGSGDGR